MTTETKEQTYEEAVEKIVNWWAEAIQQPNNQDNGDDSQHGGMAFILMNMNASNSQKSITPEKIDDFKTVLAVKMLKEKSKYLDVDYHPDTILADSAERAGIEAGVFPCKTWSRIGADNEVSVSMGYGTKPTTI